MNKNKALKTVVVVSFTFFFLASSLSPAQMIIRHNETADTIFFQLEHNVAFSTDDLILEKILGYDSVQMNTCFRLNQIGRPVVPMKEIKVAVPAGIKVTDVLVDQTTPVEIKGEYNLFPAQPPRKIDGSTDDEAIVAPDPMIYRSSQPYPSKPVAFVCQSDLGGQAIAVIDLYPIQYIPSEKRLTMFTSISFVLTGEDGYICGDYLPRAISKVGGETYQDMIKEMVVNPEDVRLQSSPEGTPQSLVLPDDGPYDHVIISSSSDASYWQPLADWHTKRGLKDTVVDTSFIYENYEGSDNPARIRNFIIDAYNTWGTMYFLLCGENSEVPFKYRTYMDDSIPSDQYYGDFDDDWLYEVFVGRVTSQGAAEINLSVQKILTYEQDPPLSDYILDATLLGMDLSTVQHDGWLTRGESLKQRIDSSYISSQFTVTEVYDTQASDHQQDFINSLNSGQNLVNHNDHSNVGVMGVGYLNHGWLIDTGDVDALTNTNEMSNIYSVGCLANAMDDPNGHDCIAEHFVVYNSLRAGVSFTGNTRSGWFYLGDPYSLSAQLDQNWWKGLMTNNEYHLGETLAYAKKNCPHSDEVWQYCQWTLNLLGEPAMPVWTDTPNILEATYPSKVPKGSSIFTVHVEDTDGDIVENASVCLWKENEVYLVNVTDSYGDATFHPSPSTRGTMYVTVTKQNAVPFIGISKCSRSKLITPSWEAFLLRIQAFFDLFHLSH